MSDAPMPLDFAIRRFFPHGGVSKPQMIAAIRRGELRAEKIGRAYLVTPGAIREWRRKLRLGYVARFILLGLYTGTRHATIVRLRWTESDDAGWLDPERGIIYRAGRTEKQTRKRRAAARMPDRLLAHVRRWARLDLAQGPQMAVVRYKGRPITRQQRGWEAVLKAAKLTDVTPHTLKHTAATWLLRAGIDLWDVAGLTSASTKTLEAIYGHHSPEFQKASAKAFRKKA